MRPLKIAMLCRWYWEENRRTGTPSGGMAQQLAEAVAALGHEVVVLSQSPDAGALQQSRVGKLEVWLSPREKRRDFLTGLRDKLAKQRFRHRKVHSDALDLRDFLKRRGRFDVLWAQSEEPDGLVAAVTAQSGVALPPVLTQIHSLRYRFAADGAPVFTEQAALGLAFRTSTRIIANSELVANCVENYASPAGSLRDKVHVVHPNLQHEFLAVAAAGTGPKPEPGRILFLGAFNEKKGALVFLDAILQSQAAKKGATFAVVGGFTEKNPGFVRRLEEKVETAGRQLGPNCLDLVGKVPSEEVIRQIQRATLVVIPSLYDEFSRAVAESLVLARPVVTTRGIGLASAVEKHKCGLVVAPGDATALAAAIDEASRPDAPYAANAIPAAARLRDDFSPAVTAAQLARHFSEIAK